MRPLNLIGLGSRVAGDDAIGIELAAALGDHEGCEVLEWGDSDGLTLAHNLLALVGDCLLIDCAEMSLEPGAWACRPLEQLRLGRDERAISTHGFGMSEALELARSLGFSQRVWLFGVQPFDLAAGCGLSRQMIQLLPQLRTALRLEVNAILHGQLRDAS